jgi:beta-glucan synthesis-associated protein KRE6
VFSDEFEIDGRTFLDGNDPRWTAVDKNDCKFPGLYPEGERCLDAQSCYTLIDVLDTNLALHYYSADNAVTTGGVLNITTEQRVNLYKAFNEKTHKFYADKKYIQSAMLQGWNKFCFVGGIIEFSAKLPGKPHIGGLWPARKYPCHCFTEGNAL